MSTATARRRTEDGLSKNQIIQELTRSPHGKLDEYVPIGMRAAVDETEFFAHLIAWNHVSGQIRDAKVALPVLSLMGVSAVTKTERIEEDPIVQNALAHLALLDLRNFVRALDFARAPGVHTVGRAQALERLVERRLRSLEANRPLWERQAVQHRRSVKHLYARYHVRPGDDYFRACLFGQDAEKRKLALPAGSLFEAVAKLKDMPAEEAAGTILRRRIPFLVAVAAMGPKLADTSVALALINAMTPTDLVSHAKMLERLGVKKNPVLRGAFEEALRKAGSSRKATLKTTTAAEAIEDDGLRDKLRALQEKQISNLGGVDGDWLICADRSPSMQEAIEFARHLASVLARFVKGKVHVVFFDGGFYKYVDATAKDLDAIVKETGRMTAGGSGTSIGAAVKYAIDKGLNVDGIAVVSDGAENTAPMFTRAYEQLCAKLAKDLPVYLYWMKCHGPSPYGNNPDSLATNMRAADHDMQIFDLRGGFDYYSLPNVVQTMRTQRYGLVEQIMDTRLLSLSDVL